jgi:putative ABC transport system substrate-binding protein
MQFDQLERRDFITLLGGAAAAWPIGARAQPGNNRRGIGVLVGDAETGPFASAIPAFQQLGWNDGNNIRMDYCYVADDPKLAKTAAAELIALAPDLIVWLVEVHRTDWQ